MTLAAVEHVLKETAEATLRGVHRRLNGAVPRDLAEHIAEVHRSGCTAIPGFWSADRCAEARLAIDQLLTDGSPGHHWRDPLGSDKRVYFAERAGGIFQTYLDDATIERARASYTGFAKPQKLVLAARMNYVPGNAGSGNGWHRDSPHRSQFKAIIYLSDVTDANGPFQYLPGSHSSLDSIRQLMNGVARANQYRFTNEEVDQIVVSGQRSVQTWTGSAGTLLLVDTKGLHRGSPMKEGARHAMTMYCFDRSVPKDFLA